MKYKLTEAEFQKMLAEEMPTLNRRARRLAKYNRKALMEQMVKPHHKAVEKETPTMGASPMGGTRNGVIR